MSVKSTRVIIDGMTYILDPDPEESGVYHGLIPAPKSADTDLTEYRSYPILLHVEDTAGNITTKDNYDPVMGEQLQIVVKKNIFITIKHWEPPDFFNASDYNRIKYNICYLKEIADILYDSVEFENMGPDKSWHEDPEPEDFRRIEENLNYISLAAGFETDTYGPYEGNYSFLNYEKLNKIEEKCRQLFDWLYGTVMARRRLPFKLGKRGNL